MKKIFAGVIGLLISSTTLFFTAQPDGLLHVYFLNVGQGDSILLQTPSGKHILVDGGPQQNVLKELNSTLPFFDRTIDDVVLTHPDRDHIEGLIYVLKRYQVKHVLFTGAYNRSPFAKEFLALIREKNIPMTIADETSDLIFDDGVRFDVLYPFHQVLGFTLNTNNTSIIANLHYGSHAVLLTGDSEAEEEVRLMDGLRATHRESDLDTELLKVGHHGSNTSSSPAFLQMSSPNYAVISCGKDNPYHHPHPSTLKKLEQVHAQIFRTDLQGRIEFIFSKNKIEKIKTG